jgi:deoxycytidylate deaminase
MESGVFYGAQQLKKKFSSYKLYVVRVSKVDDSFMNSRPCEHCIDLMNKVGIRRVIYSTDNNDFIAEDVDKMDKTVHTSFGYKYMISHIYHSKYPEITRRHTNLPKETD